MENNQEELKEIEIIEEEPDKQENESNENEIAEYEEDLTAQKRELRHQRKENRRLRMQSDKALIESQKKTIEDLNERLSKLEKNHEVASANRVDNEILKQSDIINTIKHHMSTTDDRQLHADLIEKLHDEKKKLDNLNYVKKNIKTIVKPSKKDEVSPETIAWVSRNQWFNPKKPNSDTYIVLGIDKNMVDEGWSSEDPDYFDELDRRLSKVIPHRYNGYSTKHINANSRENSTSGNVTQFKISKERKETLQQMGVWDNPKLRNEYIEEFRKYDAQNRN